MHLPEADKYTFQKSLYTLSRDIIIIGIGAEIRFYYRFHKLQLVAMITIEIKE